MGRVRRRWVAFFSFEHALGGETLYRFVAALCVLDKHPQTDIFDGRLDLRYQQYLNLLVRPCGAGWEHYEPVSSAWHRDWLWRICRQPGLRKSQADRAGDVHTAGEPLPFAASSNYAVFSDIAALIVPDPPLVATWNGDTARETWCADARSRNIRQILFKGADRCLRTNNGPQPHRHFVRALEEDDWLERLRSVFRP
jgi:hypothetical protein